jgi:hypothetical protein
MNVHRGHETGVVRILPRYGIMAHEVFPLGEERWNVIENNEELLELVRFGPGSRWR